jgi:hypothetical protein
VSAGGDRRWEPWEDCPAVKITQERGVMKCCRVAGHLNRHLDAESREEWD